MSIISFISGWLKDIVILFVLISIAQLIMPKGNTRRYINLVIGLLIIFTIISPFTRLLKLNFDIDELAFNYYKPMAADNIGLDSFDKMQERQIEELYKNRLKEEIKDLIERETVYQVGDMDMDFIGNGDYEKIDYLTIYIAKGQEKKGDIYIEKVRPVEIRGDMQADPDTGDEYDDIKSLVHQSYDIDENKIRVILFEKGKGGRDE
ncbi:MAG: stage III sporulation protein AF [Tissierellaceae bacterium]